MVFGRKSYWEEHIPLKERENYIIEEEVIEDHNEESEISETEKSHQSLIPIGPVLLAVGPSTIMGISQMEREVRENTVKAREKMSEKYKKKFTIEVFEVGEYVTLKIPREDRASTDDFRVLCRVLEHSHENNYILQSSFGTLDRQQPTKVLTRFLGELSG